MCGSWNKMRRKHKHFKLSEHFPHMKTDNG